MAKDTRRARCHDTVFGEIRCTIPYSDAPGKARALIAEWKDSIPYQCRAYDPDSKAWGFWGGYEELAIALLIEFFPDAETPRRARSHRPTAARTTGSDHFRILHLRETAPVELIEGAYWILARLNHPDAGGTTEAMQAINGANAALRERLRA